MRETDSNSESLNRADPCPLRVIRYRAGQGRHPCVSASLRKRPMGCNAANDAKRDEETSVEYFKDCGCRRPSAVKLGADVGDTLSRQARSVA
jgi:hypothetical protein